MIKDLIFRKQTPNIWMPRMEYDLCQYVISKKACRRTIKTDKYYNLPLPVHQFQIDLNYSNLYKYFCFDRLYFHFGSGENLTVAPFANTGDDGSVCLGASCEMDRILGCEESAINFVIDSFWQTSFAPYHNLMDYFTIKSGKKITTHEEWSKLEIEDMYDIQYTNSTKIRSMSSLECEND